MSLVLLNHEIGGHADEAAYARTIRWQNCRTYVIKTARANPTSTEFKENIRFTFIFQNKFDLH